MSCRAPEQSKSRAEHAADSGWISAINAGGYPKYEFGVQLIPEEDEDKFEFDLLDCTKLVPEELVPVKWVGTMTLNRNPTNYFAETEQVAFCVSNMVPGIDHSNDPMLQLRAFSYFDTQISRLVSRGGHKSLYDVISDSRLSFASCRHQGGVNFNQLPINRGVCPFITTARDGQHAHQINAGPHYYPNRFQTPNAGCPHGQGQNYATSDAAVKQFTTINPNVATSGAYEVKGVRAKQRPPKFAETVKQAQMFYNSLSKTEQEHMIAAAQFELGRVSLVQGFGHVSSCRVAFAAQRLNHC